MKPRWVGEFLGTFLIVFFGCGAGAAALLTNAHVELFHVASIWGLGISAAIYLTGSLSGAHLNPAVTCALVTCRNFPVRWVLPYIAAQFLGAFVAAAILQGLFRGPLEAFETTHAIVRGAPGSEASAMIFGEFYPNPGGQALTPAMRALVSPWTAFGVEALGTALLVLMIFGVTDERNVNRPRELTAVTIGLTVTALITVLAPLTMAGFNPARDLAPRLWSAWCGGWGGVPFTANGWGWLTVYVVAPLLGGQAGAIFYRVVLQPPYATMKNKVDG